tara:strand:- start:301 stop:558 length:258 start_codon:yes stop_codon:yes gene_type:complete
MNAQPMKIAAKLCFFPQHNGQVSGTAFFDDKYAAMAIEKRLSALQDWIDSLTEIKEMEVMMKDQGNLLDHDTSEGLHWIRSPEKS